MTTCEAAGLVARGLGEALRAVGALGRTHALAPGHRHPAPHAPVDGERQVVAVAGLGLLGPLAQLRRLLAQRGGGCREQRLVVGVLRRAAVQPVEADVVVPALEHGVRRTPPEHRLERVGQARQVARDQLVLQGERGGRDDHALLRRGRVQHRGHEVGQRLAGAGAGLHEQVPRAAEGRGDRLGHRHLARPLLAVAERGHGCCQGLGHARGAHGPIQPAPRARPPSAPPAGGRASTARPGRAQR